MSYYEPGHIWWYPYGTWTPRWWQWVLPGRGGDQYHRNTRVFHVPLVGFLVIAYGQARWPGEWCPDCREIVT